MFIELFPPMRGRVREGWYYYNHLIVSSSHILPLLGQGGDRGESISIGLPDDNPLGRGLQSRSKGKRRKKINLTSHNNQTCPTIDVFNAGTKAF
jgi:hypothetical protein